MHYIITFLTLFSNFPIYSLSPTLLAFYHFIVLYIRACIHVSILTASLWILLFAYPAATFCDCNTYKTDVHKIASNYTKIKNGELAPHNLQCPGLPKFSTGVARCTTVHKHNTNSIFVYYSRWMSLPIEHRAVWCGSSWLVDPVDGYPLMLGAQFLDGST